MSRKSRPTVNAVERLLEQRRLIQDWIAKLDSNSGDAMPPSVVERVRNDYRARLTEVMTELTEHGDSIRQGLEESQSRHDGLEAQQKLRREELAEARLRKQVGEYDDARFKEINTRLKSTLDELGKEIGSALRDIEKYEEILELIEERRPPAPAAPESTPEPEPAQEPTPAAIEPAAKQIDALDEIAFLRNLTGAGAPKPAGKAPEAPAPEPEEEPVAAEEEQAIEIEHDDDAVVAASEPEPAPEPAPVAAAAPPKGRASNDRRRSEEARTAAAEGKALMCSECGAPNLPTEWYCEKCGAELQPY